MAGDVIQLQENGAASGRGVLATYYYNNLGQRISITRGDGVSTAYSYDAAGRLSNLTHTFPTTSNSQTIGLTYSPANQVVSRTSSNPAYSWAGGGAVSQAYTVNGQNQVTAAGAHNYSFDGRGNLSSDGVNSYSYDAANNLIGFNSAATMASDGAGRLASITDLSGGTATTASRGFAYFGSALVAEYGTVGSDSGVMHDRYVPGPGTDETVVSYPGSSTATRLWSVTDERGSVIALADNNGAPYAVNTYDEYGVPATTNGGRFQYTGQMWISEAGLYHYKARDYSPSLGRFLQTDPIGYGDGMNWYAYAHNDPINGSDPTGTVSCVGCFSQVTVIAGGGYYYHADGGTYFFADGGDGANPNNSDTKFPENGVFFADSDTSSYAQANLSPSAVAAQPPADPAGLKAKAIAELGAEPPRHCAAERNAENLDKVSATMGGISTVSALGGVALSPTIVGGLALEELAADAKIAQVGTSVMAGVEHARSGNYVGAVSSVLSPWLGYGLAKFEAQNLINGGMGEKQADRLGDAIADRATDNMAGPEEGDPGCSQ